MLLFLLCLLLLLLRHRYQGSSYSDSWLQWLNCVIARPLSHRLRYHINLGHSAVLRLAAHGWLLQSRGSMCCRYSLTLDAHQSLAVPLWPLTL